MRHIILGFMVATLAGGGAVGAVDAPRHLDAAIRAQERYSERIASLENAPRQYRQPNRIILLLVPETERVARAQEAGDAELEAEAGVDEAASDQRKRRKGKRKSQPESPGGA